MSRSQRRFAVVLVLLMPAFAPAGGESNLEIRGQLLATDPADPVRLKPSKVHEIKLAKGSPCRLDLVSKEFDAYMRLLSPAGLEVARDDDSGGNNNARLRYTAKEDGTYKVVVTTYAGGTGNYVLTVQGAVKPAGQAKAVGDLVVNVEDKIDAKDKLDRVMKRPGKVHEFKVDSGTSYQIDLVSETFDSYLRLEDDAGKQLAADDDGGGDLNSRIKFTADKDATLKIFATTFDGDREGKYTLTVKIAAIGKAPAKVVEVVKQRTIGEVVLEVDDKFVAADKLDAFKKRPGKSFEVKVDKGTSYQIDLVSETLDSFLRLEDEAGKQLAFDDDSGGELNSRIKFTADRSATFKVFATTFDGEREGPFRLTMKVAGLASGGAVDPVVKLIPALPVPAPTAVAPGKLQGVLKSNDSADPVRKRAAKAHEVDLKADKSYVIDLVSEDFDCFLRLEAADGKELASNNDGGEKLNSRIAFACPADGRYRIIVTTFVGGQGRYTLSVAEQTAK